MRHASNSMIASAGVRTSPLYVSIPLIGVCNVDGDVVVCSAVLLPRVRLGIVSYLLRGSWCLFVMYQAYLK